MTNYKQMGFTLVELMIATTIFSVIMVISMYGFIRISKYYSKGIAVARMQDTARNLASDISNNLQYSVANISGSESLGYYCVGSKKYTFELNKSQGYTTGYNALQSEEVDASCNSLDPPAVKKTLLSKGTRVLSFKADKINDKLYNLNIILMYAPVDDQGQMLDQFPGTDLVEGGRGDYANWRCKTGSGSEYCSIVSVNTTIYGRL